MAKKLRVGILFGGRSGEHGVSLRSAASILKAIDRKKYEVVPIGITKQGQWLTAGNAQALLAGETGTADLTDAVAVIPPAPAVKPSRKKSKGIVTSAQPASPALDVVFPVLHGTFGEDGTIQGLFELADIAYVGSGVLGSSAGMDKDAMKRMFAASGLPMTPHVTVLRSEWKTDPKRVTRLIEKKLVYPLFVKPANLGSSVGISKVKSRADLAAAMDLAASFDRKLVIEEGVGGPGVKPRELEVAVLGNDNPEASVVGEIVPDREFYDYESKYDSSSTSEPVIPADITPRQAKQIREMAIAAFRACDCSGLARVDFLMEPPVDANGKKIKNPRIVLNEINTMPGFTSISMYPKLWEATGIPYKELISRLIELGLQRQAEKRETSFSKDTL